jgi:hypothetical protein
VATDDLMRCAACAVAATTRHNPLFMAISALLRQP